MKTGTRCFPVISPPSSTAAALPFLLCCHTEAEGSSTFPPCEAAYSASKAGVGGLTQALAKELARSKIPVNALACGVIDTEMNKQLDEEERAELAEDIPAGRFATPEEVAEMVWKLICAPEYLTGQIITFDGGYL